MSEVVYALLGDQVEFIRQEDLVKELSKPLPDDFESYTPGSIWWRHLPGEIAPKWMPQDLIDQYGEMVVTDMGAGQTLAFDADDELPLVAGLEAVGHQVRRDDETVDRLYDEP